MIPANDDAIKSIKLLVGLMADAIVEAHEGLLTVAYQDEEADDITMDDVIRNVDEQNEARRRARQEERRARDERRRQHQQAQAANTTFNRNRKFVQRVESQVEQKQEEAAPAETKSKETTQAEV